MSFTLQVFLFFFLPVITLVTLASKSLFYSPKPRKNLPPSPSKIPIIGNLHQLGSSPHRALQAMAQSYGPLMLLHLGSVPVLVATSIEAAKDIMKTHDLIFANRPRLNIPARIFYDNQDIAFSQYGEYWRQVKSISVLHLLSNKRVQSYRNVREDEMDVMMQKIRSANGLEFNLSELLFSLTGNVVCRATLGKKYEESNFKDLFGRTVEILGRFSVGNYIPSLRWVDRLSGLERKADEIAKEFDNFLEGVIDEHLNEKGVTSADSQALVDILLQLQRDNVISFRLERDMIKAIIMDLFLAGTDTTYTTLEWAICELLRHPRAMQQLKQEAQQIGQGRSLITEDYLDKMYYLKAILKETLRLHAPVPLLAPRESMQDVKIQGYDVPSGTQVLVNVWAIARDPLNWEEPEEFRPERFLNSSVDYKGFDFELTPFGAGRRGCPGIQFAMNVNELVLANLVYKFDLALVDEKNCDISEISGITVHKKHPLLVLATACS